MHGVIRVAPLEEKWTDSRFRLFGHIQRRLMEAPLRRVLYVFWPGEDKEREAKKDIGRVGQD